MKLRVLQSNNTSLFIHNDNIIIRRWTEFAMLMLGLLQNQQRVLMSRVMERKVLLMMTPLE